MSSIVGINQFGQIAGIWGPPLGQHYPSQGFVWQNGSTTLIANGPAPAFLIAINNNGQLLGSNGGGGYWTWSAGVFTPLQLPPVFLIKDESIRAVGMNDSLQVAGYAIVSTFFFSLLPHGYLWSSDGTPKEITDFIPAAYTALPVALNNTGQVLLKGAVFPPVPAKGNGWVWQSGKLPKNLGSLGEGDTSPAALNDSGQVTGWSIPSGATYPTTHAFLWQNGSMQDLGLPLGAASSSGVSIDSTGRVVVTAIDASGNNYSLWVWQNGIYTQLAGYYKQTRAAIATVGAQAIVASTCLTNSFQTVACIWIVP